MSDDIPDADDPEIESQRRLANEERGEEMNRYSVIIVDEDGSNRVIHVEAATPDDAVLIVSTLERLNLSESELSQLVDSPKIEAVLDNDPTTSAPYELVVRSQAGAEELLRELGALAEIERAVLDHCKAHRPKPLYKPQEYKERLEAFGWIREARVPPYSPELDEWPVNDKYDMLKFFERGGSEVGVAIEMEGWQINNDLLKFRRGVHRGQIVAGVLLQPHYYDLSYCFDHMRRVNEPLFSDLPILFVCPRGPGLKEPKPVRTPTYQPFLMPKR